MVLRKKTKTISEAAFLLAFFTFLSRIFGLLRDNFLANFFERSQTDIYFAAFKIPDFIYAILFIGVIATVFLPLFSEHFERNQEKGKEFFKLVLTTLFLIVIFLALIGEIFAPYLIKILVPGFSFIQRKEATLLTRILFLSPLILGLSSLFSAILQYFDLFWAIALAPIFYNLGIIFGILVLSPYFGLKGVAIGVILGAIFHFLCQFLPAKKEGFSLEFSFNFADKKLKKLFYLSFPRILSVASFQINLIIITFIASFLREGSLSVFNFANNLQGVILGVIGISFARAVFPKLSKSFAKRNFLEYKKIFTKTFQKILYLSLFSCLFLFLFRKILVKLIFGTKLFPVSKIDNWTISLISANLGVFSFGILFFCLIPLLTRAFFAQKNTKTPLKISIFSIAINIFLSFELVRLIGTSKPLSLFLKKFFLISAEKDITILGLSLALVLSSALQFFLLICFLKRTPPFLESLRKLDKKWPDKSQEDSYCYQSYKDYPNDFY